MILYTIFFVCLAYYAGYDRGFNKASRVIYMDYSNPPALLRKQAE